MRRLVSEVSLKGCWLVSAPAVFGQLQAQNHGTGGAGEAQPFARQCRVPRPNRPCLEHGGEHPAAAVG